MTELEVLTAADVQEDTTSVSVGALTKSLADGCFAKARNSLARVTFARDSCLINIGKDAFAGCKKLVEIEIPASVESIGRNCFSHRINDDYIYRR